MSLAPQVGLTLHGIAGNGWMKLHKLGYSRPTLYIYEMDPTVLSQLLP
jgi:hypothetical protein